MHIFDIDTTTATADDIRTTTQAYLLASQAQFTLRATEILHQEGLLRLGQLIATAVAAGPPPPALEAMLNELPGGYKTAAADIFDGRDLTNALLQRRAVIDLYDVFELYISDLLAVLFFAFPKFLTTAPENIVLPTTHYDDLYGPASLLQARLLVARRKVAQLIQSENLIDLIKKTEQRFGVMAKSLVDEDRKALLELAARRNLWVHNSGRVNDIYVRLLKRYGIAPTIAVGSLANIDEPYVQAIRELTMRAATALSKDLFDDVPQIQQHHGKL